jgi:hypothetical protein
MDSHKGATQITINQASQEDTKMAIELKPISPKNISFYIRGTSPLIMHAWSEKGLAMMRMTAAERKKQPKVGRDPETEATNCLYKTDGGEIGIPLTAFKASLIGAAHKDFGLEKTLLRKSFFIPSTDSKMIVPITYVVDYVIREDIVRIGANQTDLRYRPEFKQWRAKITAQIDPELLKVEDIVNLINRAGFSVGIGEWRPEKGGEYGRFELDTSEPVTEEDM